MKRLKDFRIGIKLNLISGGMVFLIVLLMSGYNYLHRKSELIKDMDYELIDELKDFENLLNLEISEKEQYLQVAMDSYENWFNSKGRIRFDENHLYNISLTENSQLLSIPRWLVGDKPVLRNAELVDFHIGDREMITSLFQKIPDGFVCIATNLLDSLGSPALFTMLDNQSPISQAILEGNNYKGQMLENGFRYRVMCKPYYLNNKLIGMVLIGVSDNFSSAVKSLFYAKKLFGNGFPYLIDDKGFTLIHPTAEGIDGGHLEVFQRMKENELGYGNIEYEFEGKKKFNYFQRLDNIHAFLAVSVFEDDVISSLKSLRWSFIIMSLLAILIFLIMNYFFSRSITRELNKGVVFAQQIANGEFDARLVIKNKDEIGELSQALNQMVNKLHEVVSGVRISSQSITVASKEMTGTSDHLSRGASDQASTIEELSATTEEVSGMISSNASNALRSETIADKTQTSIQKVINEAIEAVEANKKIEAKIDLITDIAFQTNILALNAAVEAARAGEKGAGFSVVAGEVKKLAETTKNAANDITNIIKDNLSKSEKSGANLRALLPEITQTVGLVKDIAHSSNQQTLGVDQINDALQQLNQLAQQNASTAEEMDANADQLNNLADELKQLISFFKL